MATETESGFLERRGILHLGTLITIFTGASAVTTLGASSAHALPGDKNSPMAYVPTAEKGVASGVATLDLESKIPHVQLPDLTATINDRIETSATDRNGPIATAVSNSSGVSIEAFGAVGDDPTADNRAAIEAAVAAGVPLIIPAKSYRVASRVTCNFSGTRITGIPGARIYSDITAEIIRLNTTDDAVFTNIVFETTTSGSTESGALVQSYSSVRNTVFDKCIFRSLTRAANGLHFVVDGVSADFCLDNIIIKNCLFECARMGAEFQDHTPNQTYTKVRGVTVKDSIFRYCGSLLHGIDLSFSGPHIGSSSIRNKFIGSLVISAEFAGAHVSPQITDNEFVGLGDAARQISMTNSSNEMLVKNAVLERNRTLDRSGAGPRLWNLIDARLSNNTFQVKGQVHFRDCQRLVSQGDTYDSSGNYALWGEHNAAAKEFTYNVWKNANLVTTSGGAFSCARFQGPKAMRNRIEDSRFSRVGGTRMDQTSNAAMNHMLRAQRDASPYVTVRSYDLADSSKTLSLEDIDTEVLIFYGITTTPRTVTFPAAVRCWRVRNQAPMSLTLTAGGNSIALAPNTSIFFTLDNLSASYA